MTCVCHPNGADQIKMSKMGGACRMYGGKGRFVRDFGGET